MYLIPLVSKLVQLFILIITLAISGTVEGAPPPPLNQGSFTTTVTDSPTQVNITFSFDENFTSQFNVSTYNVQKVTDSTTSDVECFGNGVCQPADKCKCIVRDPPSRDVTFTISATNGDGQGEVITVASYCPIHGLGKSSNESCTSSNADSSVTIDNGVGCYNSNQGIGFSATYECTEGFELCGSNMRTCLYNGSWSGTTPDCVLPASTTPSSAGIQTLSVLLTTVALLLAHTIS